MSQSNVHAGIEPTQENIKRVRIEAGMTQAQAAEVARLAHPMNWSQYERGVGNIDRARWELFLIKVGKHPHYGPRG